MSTSEELPHYVKHAPDHRVPAPQLPLHIETAGCEHIMTGLPHPRGRVGGRTRAREREREEGRAGGGGGGGEKGQEREK